MSRIGDELMQQCRAQPDSRQQVVITLTEGAADRDPATLGLEDAQPIEGLDGVYVASLTGDALMRLAARDEIEEIVEDFDVLI